MFENVTLLRDNSSPSLNCPLTFVPENHVQELLAVGSQSPEKALEFYMKFLNAKIVTLGRFEAVEKEGR